MTGKVLITGATGFIGEKLIHFLCSKNYSVRVLLRQQSLTEHLPDHVEIFIGDLSDAGSLIGLCKGIQTVFHLAGIAHVSSHKNPQLARLHHEVNFQGTQYLLAEAVQAEVSQFIYCSSVKAVAENFNARITPEWEKTPVCSYGQSKRASEEAALQAGIHHKMHVCILRPALVYGPRWKGNLAMMLKAIDRDRFVPLPQVPAFKSMISVNDFCRAALAATQKKANGKIYFLTDNIDYSSRDIYIEMRRALGKTLPKWYVPLCVFKSLAVVGDFFQKYLKRDMPFNSEIFDKLFGWAAYDSTCIQTDLDFKPQETFTSVLPSIIAAYREKEGKHAEQY